MSLIVDSDEKTSRSSVNETKSLAGQAHGGCVNNWQVLLDVFRQKAEEQFLISVLKSNNYTINKFKYLCSQNL